MTLDAECPWSLPLVCGMPGAAAWVVAGWWASRMAVLELHIDLVPVHRRRAA